MSGKSLEAHGALVDAQPSAGIAHCGFPDLPWSESQHTCFANARTFAQYY